MKRKKTTTLKSTAVDPRCDTRRRSSPLVNLQRAATTTTAAISATTPAPASTSATQNSTSATAADMATACTHWYKVKENDTCWAIANYQAQVTLEDFKAMNPTLSCHRLQIGDHACLAPVPEYVPGCDSYVKVKSGDTCNSLAQASNLTLEQLLGINKLLNCSSLQLNTRICLGPLTLLGGTNGTSSNSTTTASWGGANSTHSTTTGVVCDTWVTTGPNGNFWDVVIPTGLSLKELIQLNPGMDWANIPAGSKLCVGPIPPAQITLANGEVKECQDFHRVAEGDTCESIAADDDLSVHQLLEINPEMDCFALQLNTRLCTLAC